MAISKHEHGKQGRVILQPFALPSEGAVKFYKRLRERVFVQEKGKTKGGLETLKRRRLNIVEKELILWQLVFNQVQRGNNVFYARDLLTYPEW